VLSGAAAAWPVSAFFYLAGICLLPLPVPSVASLTLPAPAISLIPILSGAAAAWPAPALHSALIPRQYTLYIRATMTINSRHGIPGVKFSEDVTYGL